MRRVEELPLAGLRVLALSQFGAGPFGTMHLADLGAEVIKIEDPTVGGDVSRFVPPYSIPGDSLFFQALNRNKKSITLNLRHDDGQALFHELVRHADAVFSNLRGDQPAKLGLTYDDLKPYNPRIVCVALTGFGLTGPHAHEPGYDYLMQGYAGWMSLTGEPDAPPARAGLPVVDWSGGLLAMLGLMVGMWRARATGQGCDVDISMLDMAIAMLNYVGMFHLNGGFEPTREPRSAHPTLVPCEVFPTQDGYMLVMCLKDKFWDALCAAIERPDLHDDPRFRTFADRLAHRRDVEAALDEVFHEHPTAVWLERLRGRVPCGPVYDVPQAVRQEQVAARDLLIRFPHPHWQEIQAFASAIRIPQAPPRAHSPGPALGQHTEGVLREL
ncbi:MAG: CoA transferase, partial [Chloroflexi bacterium]|nr:CoA transferase [Chloroflexota bacterium]